MRRNSGFLGRLRPGAATLVVWTALAAAPIAAAGSVCAYKNESGAIVYTNTPTKGGLCASASSAPPLARASSRTVMKYDSTIRSWAAHYGVPPGLVHAMVATESAYNPGAISAKGARGLMQLMPATARRYGVKNSFNPEENIRGGVAHLRDLLDDFRGDTRLAVAAYNAGRGAVRKYSGVPPFAETRQYVARVLGRFGGGGARSASLVKSTGKVELRVASNGEILLVN